MACLIKCIHSACCMIIDENAAVVDANVQIISECTLLDRNNRIISMSSGAQGIDKCIKISTRYIQSISTHDVRVAGRYGA